MPFLEVQTYKFLSWTFINTSRQWVKKVKYLVTKQGSHCNRVQGKGCPQESLQTLAGGWGRVDDRTKILYITVIIWQLVYQLC